MPHNKNYAYLVGSQLQSNGFELSRPARIYTCFSSIPFQNLCFQIAISAGSAAARDCVKTLSEF